MDSAYDLFWVGENLFILRVWTPGRDTLEHQGNTIAAAAGRSALLIPAGEGAHTCAKPLVVVHHLGHH
jgi:hypothetical protein